MAVPNTNNLKQFMAVVGALLVCLSAAFTIASLPSPKTGGPSGGPISILFLANPTGMQKQGVDFMDAQYRKELLGAGYRVTQANLTQRITPEFLRHFGVVVLTGLPYAGQKYEVGGDIFSPVDGNLRILTDYVRDGGGMIVTPAMSEFGEAYADTYNRFLQTFDARLLPQQLRDDQNTRGTYASGTIEPSNLVGEGLKDVLYPIGVMRWDNAYSTTPVVTGKDWTVVAHGKNTSGSYQAIDNSKVGKRLTDNRTIFAFRRYEKGFIAVSAIHAYYTLSHAYLKDKSIGENDTGVIDGAVLHGIKGDRNSDFGALLDQTFRAFAANSAANSIGGGEGKLTAVELPSGAGAPIDWHTAKAPPTWQHRLVTTKEGYSVEEDPAVHGELKYFKILIGPRTSISSGKGSVKEYRDAAIKSGYSAIGFCETFADIDPAKWDAYIADCKANSDEKLVCLPGFDFEDFQGGRYLVISAERFPDESWLTADHKKLEATRMLSLGWFGQVASVHRGSTDNALNYKMYKQHQAITVYTYDGSGKLADDSLKAYQWSVESDSNPIPITAHELDNPGQVATAATAGFQQIMPAPSLALAIDYFRFGFPHYFECPLRYFISEGPILDGWSILNKDLGPADTGHDRYRIDIGLRSDQPIAEAKLFDGFDMVGRWTPKTNEFRTDVTGSHNAQHEFLLLASDSTGKRVLSPGMRTTTQNWRLRCGDRQNWLGSFWIYTGWNLNSVPFFDFPLEGKSFNVVPIFDYPFFSNHVQLAEADLSYRYVNTFGQDVGGDAKATYAVTPSQLFEGTERTTYFSPLKNENFGVMLVESHLKLKQDAKPVLHNSVYPTISEPRENNQLVILPQKPPITLTPTTRLDLPVGSYACGIVPLSEGFRIDGSSIGLAAPATSGPLSAGQEWNARYLLLRTSQFRWRNMGQSFPADSVAEKALTQMGFRGPTPYAFELNAGKLNKLAYFADFTADQGAVSGTCRNDHNEPLLFNVPFRIAGLNGRCDTVLWRSDSPALTPFACFEGKGYIPFDADKNVDFYAGVVANCDPALFVSSVIWNDKEAWFRVNNPTDAEIASEFITPIAIKGLKPIRRSIKVPAGSSIDVKG